jgi:hypothetical protein
MSDKLTDLFDCMATEALKHMRRTEPVLEMTEDGFVPTGATTPVWQAKDIVAFTSLLKLADFKHIDENAGTVNDLRDELKERRERREQIRSGQGRIEAVSPTLNLPPLDLAL